MSNQQRKGRNILVWGVIGFVFFGPWGGIIAAMLYMLLD